MAGGLYALWFGSLDPIFQFSILIGSYMVLMSLLGGVRSLLRSGGRRGDRRLRARVLQDPVRRHAAPPGRRSVCCSPWSCSSCPTGCIPGPDRRCSTGSDPAGDLDPRGRAPPSWLERNGDRAATRAQRCPDARRPRRSPMSHWASVTTQRPDQGRSAAYAPSTGPRSPSRHGKINALIGPNGSGKTTFFNCVTGMIKPDSGTVTYRGRDITGQAPHRIAGAGIGRSFQLCRIFPRMTVLDNMLVGGPRRRAASHRLRGCAQRRRHRQGARAAGAGSASTTSSAPRPATSPTGSRSCSSSPGC